MIEDCDVTNETCTIDQDMYVTDGWGKVHHSKVCHKERWRKSVVDI